MTDRGVYSIVVSEVAQLVGKREAIVERLSDAAEAYGGHYNPNDKAIFWAVFQGTDHAERAVRSALAMRAELTAYYHEAHSRQRSTLSIGIDTLNSHTAPHDEQRIDAICQSLTQLGLENSIIISHETYRWVRGIFDIDALEELDPTERLHTTHYLVQRARPRAFRLPLREVAGQETHIVGRQKERGTLKKALDTMLDKGSLQVVTIMGAAGMGKSRLLYDFQNYLELFDREVWLFRANSWPHLRYQPFSLIRNLLTFRFEILSSDTTATARQAIVRGVQRFIPDTRGEAIAHYIGQLIGLNFMYSDHIRRLQESGQPVAERAIDALAEFFRAVADDDPAAILIEGLDMADNASLDALRYVFQRCHNSPLLFICTADPSFAERPTHWAELPTYHEILLPPLGDEDIATLAQEILSGQPPLSPEDIAALVADAKGNPLHLEERILELMSRRVLGTDATKAGTLASHLHKHRSLESIIAQRLFLLPEKEAYVLRRATCIGERFWLAMLQRLLDGVDEESLENTLQSLIRQGFIRHVAPSTFSATREYQFKHPLLYAVAREQSQDTAHDHALIANWRVEHSAQRVNEYAGILAERYERAGKSVQASEYYIRAGKQAESVGALYEASRFYAAALRLIDASSTSKRAALSYALSHTLFEMGEFEAAQGTLDESLDLAERIGDQLLKANVLTVKGCVAQEIEGRDMAEQYFKSSLNLARAIGDRRSMSENLMRLGELALDHDDLDLAQQCFRESLSIYQTIRQEHRIATIFLSMSRLSLRKGNLDEAETLALSSLRIAHRNQIIRLLLTTLAQVAEIKMQRGQKELMMDIVYTVREHPFVTPKILKRLEQMSKQPAGHPRDTAQFMALVESLLD